MTAFVRFFSCVSKHVTHLGGFGEIFLRKPLSRWCTNFATVQWGEAIFRRRIESFVENCSQNQSPRWVTSLLTQEKSLTNAVIVIGVENVYKTTVLKTHKFSHRGAKPFLEGKLWVLWQMYPTPTSQTSPMLTHTGEKLYKRRSVIYVENIFPNHWPEDAQI